MKNLKNLIKGTTKTTCGFHNELKIPNLRPLEYCNDCKISICYTCGNNHIDKFCNLEWGIDVLEHLSVMNENLTEKNEKFNLGYPFILNLEKLKCPCGSDFLSKSTSTICSACGTATCSPECHREYMQNDKKCVFINNFIENEETQNIQGLRLIKLTDFLFAMKNDLPLYSPTSLSNSKFIKSMMSPYGFHFIMQRGFRQYGQPHV